MRIIRVLINFGGRITREQRIPPGEYVENDPRLLGVADYLLANGHAIVVGRVDEPPKGEQPEDEQPTDEPPEDEPPKGEQPAPPPKKQPTRSKKGG